MATYFSSDDYNQPQRPPRTAEGIGVTPVDPPGAAVTQGGRWVPTGLYSKADLAIALLNIILRAGLLSPLTTLGQSSKSVQSIFADA